MAPLPGLGDHTMTNDGRAHLAMAEKVKHIATYHCMIRESGRMFYDACLLLGAVHADFDANNNDVFCDILLLENQLPWLVVEACARSTR